MARKLPIVEFGLTLALFTGCAGEIQTGFKGDISRPMDGMSLSSVAILGNGPFPTQYCYEVDGKYTSDIAVKREDGDINWALGGSCVFRPLREVWAAYNNRALMQWPEAEAYDAALGIPPTGVQILWNTHYHLSRFPVGSIDWDMTWYHTLLKGSPADPRQVVINYGKVNGTSFIKHWQGSVLLEFVTPTVTSITIKDTLKATNQSSENSEATVRALISHARKQASAPGEEIINALPNQTVPVSPPSEKPKTPTIEKPENR